MNREALKELEERIRELGDAELIEMVRNAGDYQEEALEIARRELKSRRISWEEEQATEPFMQDADPTGLSELAANTHFKCRHCGGLVRRGALVAGDADGAENPAEALVQFHDLAEQRYCFVLVCTRCGRAELIVDFMTPVKCSG
jgi:hypothetical protein